MFTIAGEYRNKEADCEEQSSGPSYYHLVWASDEERRNSSQNIDLSDEGTWSEFSL